MTGFEMISVIFVSAILAKKFSVLAAVAHSINIRMVFAE
jgi:hypothetical protein